MKINLTGTSTVICPFNALAWAASSGESNTFCASLGPTVFAPLYADKHRVRDSL